MQELSLSSRGRTPAAGARRRIRGARCCSEGPLCQHVMTFTSWQSRQFTMLSQSATVTFIVAALGTCMPLMIMHDTLQRSRLHVKLSAIPLEPICFDSHSCCRSIMRLSLRDSPQKGMQSSCRSSSRTCPAWPPKTMHCARCGRNSGRHALSNNDCCFHTRLRNRGFCWYGEALSAGVKVELLQLAHCAGEHCH